MTIFIVSTDPDPRNWMRPKAGMFLPVRGRLRGRMSVKPGELSMRPDTIGGDLSARLLDGLVAIHDHRTGNHLDLLLKLRIERVSCVHRASRYVIDIALRAGHLDQDIAGGQLLLLRVIAV